MKRFVTEKPEAVFVPFKTSEEMVQAWNDKTGIRRENGRVCIPPFQPYHLLDFHLFGTLQTPNCEPATCYITYTGIYSPHATFDKGGHEKFIRAFDGAYSHVQELKGWFVDEPDEVVEEVPKPEPPPNRFIKEGDQRKLPKKELLAGDATVSQPDHNFRVGDKVRFELLPDGWPIWNFDRKGNGTGEVAGGRVVGRDINYVFRGVASPAVSVEFMRNGRLVNWWFPLPEHPLYAPGRPGWPERIKDE